MTRRRLPRLLPLAFALLGGLAWADGPSADEVARQMLARDAFGWESGTLRARLVLTTADGKRDERAFEGASKRSPGVVRTVVRFRAPERVAGTAFLLVERDGGQGEQHVYLPAYHTTRRIAGREREGSFMGSDFTYADLDRRDLRDARYALLPDEKVGEAACFVLETSPKAEGSPYARVVSFLRKADFVPLRVQFFAKDGKLAKTTSTRRVRMVDGKPVVVESHTENATTHHVTDLIVDEIEPHADVPDSAFEPAALERG